MAVLKQKLKIMVRTADSAQHENPREAFGAMKISNMETPEKTNIKSNSTVVK